MIIIYNFKIDKFYFYDFITNLRTFFLPTKKQIKQNEIEYFLFFL